MAIISRRRLIYYTIVLTSFFWVFGTVSFFLIQSLEVDIEVKTRSAHYLPLQTPKWKLRVRNAVLPLADFKSPAMKEQALYNKTLTTATVGKKVHHAKEIFLTANYENLPKGAKKSGPGAKGEGVTVDEARKDEEDEGYEQHAFNLVASNMISLHRTLEDHRMKG